MKIAAVDLYQNFKQKVTSIVKAFLFHWCCNWSSAKNLFLETSTNVAILYFWKLCFSFKKPFFVLKYGPAVFNVSKFSNSSGNQLTQTFWYFGISILALHACVIHTVFSWTLIIYKTFLIKSCYLKMLLNNMYTITMFSISRYYKIVIPCSKLYSLQTSITLSIREVSTQCYKTATEWEFQVIKLYLIGRGFSGPGVAIKRPCFNFFHSLPHLSLYWSTKTKISEKTFSCKSKNKKNI